MSAGGFDYRELEKYIQNFQKASESFETWLISFLQENANWLIKQTVEATPVDTGNLRRQWKITKVRKLSSGNIGFVLINYADYASYVEFGHATRNRKNWVEGYFMCTISIDKLDRYLPRRFEKELIAFMKGYGLG